MVVGHAVGADVHATRRKPRGRWSTRVPVAVGCIFAPSRVRMSVEASAVTLKLTSPAR